MRVVGRAGEEWPWLAALVLMTLVGFAIAAAAGIATGVPAHRVTLEYVRVIWMVAPATILLGLVALTLRALALGVRNPLGEAMAFARARFGTPMCAAATIVPILMVPWLMGSFGTLKMLMPLARPFEWDDRFAAIDRMLFLGTQPWHVTHALFGSAAMTHVIDFIYSIWTMLLFTAVLGFAWLAPRYERARFFLSFGAAWLLIGVVGAYVFASAGPCFAALIGSASAPEYAPLMRRLLAIHQQSPLGAYAWQEMLWRHHADRHYAFAMGISAMPSMHNAITCLYALSTRRAPLAWRIAVWAFVALIFIGSIHLGWHYCVDGLAAFAMMSAIWWAAGRFLDRVGVTAALLDQSSDSAINEPGALVTA